jgi:hypothetical protein
VADLAAPAEITPEPHKTDVAPAWWRRPWGAFKDWLMEDIAATDRQARCSLDDRVSLKDSPNGRLDGAVARPLARMQIARVCRKRLSAERG